MQKNETAKLNAKKMFVSEYRSQIRCFKKRLQDAMLASSKDYNNREYNIDNIIRQIHISVNEIIPLANIPTFEKIDKAIEYNNLVFDYLMLLKFAIILQMKREKEQGYVAGSEEVFK